MWSRDREGEAKGGQVKERWDEIHCVGEKRVDALEARKSARTLRDFSGLWRQGQAGGEHVKRKSTTEQHLHVLTVWVGVTGTEAVTQLNFTRPDRLLGYKDGI